LGYLPDLQVTNFPFGPHSLLVAADLVRAALMRQRIHHNVGP
jgi:hypothetical protein